MQRLEVSGAVRQL